MVHLWLERWYSGAVHSGASGQHGLERDLGSISCMGPWAQLFEISRASVSPIWNRGGNGKEDEVVP